MRVICSQTLLTRTLHAMSRILKHEVFPLSQSVLLSAQSVEQGRLTLLGIGRSGTVGMLSRIPATIEEEGEVFVPIEPFAEYSGTLRSSSLVLSQESKECASHRQEAGPLGRPAHPEKAPPLKIESSYTSQAGTTSMYRASLKTWEVEKNAVPPLTRWQREALPIATVPVLLLREAIAGCTTLANMETPQKRKAPEMYGILLQGDSQGVNLLATSGTMLISRCFSLEQPDLPSCSLLLDGKALYWMREVLPKEGDVALSLARNGKQSILLVTGDDLSLFCLAKDEVPTTWKHILLSPHETELLVSRKEFARVLAPFAALPLEKHQGLALSVEGATLSLRVFPTAERTLQEAQTIRLARASEKRTIFVNPEHLKRIVRATSATMLQFHIGHFERWEHQRYRTIGFLRLQSQHSSMMMSLSRQVQRPLPDEASQNTKLAKERSEVRKEACEKEMVL